MTYLLSAPTVFLIISVILLIVNIRLLKRENVSFSKGFLRGSLILVAFFTALALYYFILMIAELIG